jgi:transcriptional regulator with XRE-family HTH domain
MSTVGRRALVAWLDRIHLRPCDFAAELTISRPYMSQILSGARRPGLMLICRIAARTGIPPQDWTRDGVPELPKPMSKMDLRKKDREKSTIVSNELTGAAAS